MNTERYQRQTILKGFGLENQKKLLNAKVLVIGAGGLGVPVLIYLNAMGVGTLGIVDNDVVSYSNLHRQVLYTEKMVGQPKVVVAKKQLQKQNSETYIKVYRTFLSAENVFDIIKNYDVIVDATDNFPTRYLINDACVILKKPFVYGALHGFEGQVSVFNYQKGPTYRCLFPTMPSANEVPDCNEHGVLGILPGIIGNLQALEVIKVLTGVGEVLSGELMLYDGLSQRMQKMKFRARPDHQQITELASNYDFECQVPFKSMGAEEFKGQLEKGSIELIDVRSREEFQASRLRQAKNIPLDELMDRLHEVNFEASVYFICQSGVRSQKAIALLSERFSSRNFVNVAGGMNKFNSYADTY